MDPVKLLVDLIRIPSLPGREGELAKFVKDVISSLGVDKVWIDSLGNVIALIKGEVSGRALVIEGHLDTVGPGDLSKWLVDPYSGKVVNGRVYGRGASDMKGAIASQLVAIEGIKEPPVNVYLTYTTHEETAEGVAFRYLIENEVKDEVGAVVIGEATSLNLAIGHRGRAVIKFELVGEEAHASMPEEGINALICSSQVIKDVPNLSNSFPKDEVLGSVTASPTIINCLSRDVPHIPGRCVLYVDVRVVRGVSESELISKLSNLCRLVVDTNLCKDCSVSINEEVLKFWRGTEIKVKEFFPAWVCSDLEAIELGIKALKEVGINASKYVWRFSTDGVYSAGIANYLTIGFGPGSESLAHKVNEYVEINELRKAVLGYRVLIKYLGNYLVLSNT